MLVGSPLVWLLPLFFPFESSAKGSWQTEPVTARKKIDKLEGEATCVYCAILLRRAAGAEWLLLVFIGAY